MWAYTGRIPYLLSGQNDNQECCRARYRGMGKVRLMGKIYEQIVDFVFMRGEDDIYGRNET